MTKRIPTTVVTGFLGAGKTSLIRHIINHNDGRRLAFLINEFGDLGVDRELLLGCGDKGCSEDDVVELANGCICCTVADDFVPTMKTLLEQTNSPDHIIIETSGLALPKPLIQAFNWPEIRSELSVDGVIAVVDAAAIEEGKYAYDLDAIERQRSNDPSLNHETPLEEVYQDQLACADMVILNKTDMLEGGSLAHVSNRVSEHTRRGVSVLATSHAKIDPGMLLGLDVAAETNIDSRPSHHDGIEGEHDHNDFDSFTLNLDPIKNADEFHSKLSAMVRRHNILRIKGFLDRPGRERREVIQGVGPRIERYFDRAWRQGETRQSRIVIIGKADLDRKSIANEIQGQMLE